MNSLLLRSFLIGFLSFPVAAAALDQHQLFTLDLFKQLVEINTTQSAGNTLEAAELVAAKLRQAGFSDEDIHVVKMTDRKANLVVRLRSPEPSYGPILLLSHIDVVEANPEDWSKDPFTFITDGDHYYGRGTMDDKNEAAIHIANLIRMKQQGYQPNRDIIVALTADEEGGPNNGVMYLLEHHRELVEADFVINEGGGGVIEDGKFTIHAIESAQKIYQSFTLEVTNPGGHSSRPEKKNAIYQLARALLKIDDYQFPIELNETTRAYFAGTAQTRAEPEASLMRGLLQTPPASNSIAHFETISSVNPLLRTTCIATQVEAGHAENALPQRAMAKVNCRLMPGSDATQIMTVLSDVIADNEVAIGPVFEGLSSEASPLSSEIIDSVTAVTDEMWPGALVVPSMTTGATDALFFRNAGMPVYGVSGIFNTAGETRIHGRDERILIRSFHDGSVFLDRLVRMLTSPLDATSNQTL